MVYGQWNNSLKQQTVERASVSNVSNGEPIGGESWAALGRDGRDDGVVDMGLVGREGHPSGEAFGAIWFGA
jgi:hypothetical protein